MMHDAWWLFYGIRSQSLYPNKYHTVHASNICLLLINVHRRGKVCTTMPSYGCLNNDHSIIIFHHIITLKIIHRFIHIQNDRNNINSNNNKIQNPLRTLVYSCLILSAQQLLHDITYASIHTYCTLYACRVCWKCSIVAYVCLNITQLYPKLFILYKSTGKKFKRKK